MPKMPVNRKKIFALAGGAALVIVAVLLFMALRPSVPSPSASGKLQIVTTLFPLYDFARQVGGDKADVTLLLPPGVDPHSFEPRPSDILKIDQTGVFVYTGKFMEPWAAELASSLPKSVAVVDASKGIELQLSVFHDADEPPGAPDPHIWMDFGNDKIIVDGIADALGAKDPADAAYFRANADAYEARLSGMDAEFRNGLADCASRELIYGGHYALGYLARRYGLTYLAAQGVSPDAEPTAQDLASLVDQIRAKGVKYVFYEELESPKIAQTLAAETGAKLLLINAAHNVSRDDLEKGTTFIDIMEADLANLKTGLQCRG